MDYFLKHFIDIPALAVIAVAALINVISSILYFNDQYKKYGHATKYAKNIRKRMAGFSAIIVIGIVLYGLTPYVAPPTGQIALIIGNTKNTPRPVLSQDISDAIERTMLMHRGEDVYTLTESIRIISAVKKPEVINLDVSKLRLREIGRNDANAKRSAKLNVKAIQEYVNNLAPTDNGADYLEAIKMAKDNLDEGSKIIVIGSGLSDHGDLNFSRSNILFNKDQKDELIKKIRAKNGPNYLDGYSIVFYGLGDTVSPQEALSTAQKNIVRDMYKSVIRSLGGDVEINTKTLSGESVNTEYVVGMTDTGCGNLGLVFDDDNLKFIPDSSTLIDPSASKNTLMTISSLWDKYKENIDSIQIDGYIAHHLIADNLSQKRADAVKRILVELGIPSKRITAIGRGFGPYRVDAQNRMVKVTISRNNELCGG